MPSVIEIRDREQLEQQRLIWTRLWQQTPSAGFLHSLDWVASQALPPGVELRVLMTYSHQRPIGILPLLHTRQLTVFGTRNRLTLPHPEWGASPLGPNPTATFTIALRYLRSCENGRSVLSVDGSAADGKRLTTALRQVGMRPSDVTLGHRAHVQTSGKDRPPDRGPCDEPVAMDEMTFERYRPAGSLHGDDDPRWELFDLLRIVSGEAPPASLRDAHATAAARGALDIALLRHVGTPVAFSYNYVTDGQVASLWSACDKNLPTAPMMRCLARELLDDSAARGDERVDLGKLQPAGRWTAEVRPLRRVTASWK